MLFITQNPVTHLMAASVREAVLKIDPQASVRSEVSGNEISIDGDLSADQAQQALQAADCMPARLQAAGEQVHVQGGHTCCGHCT